MEDFEKTQEAIKNELNEVNIKLDTLTEALMKIQKAMEETISLRNANPVVSPIPPAVSYPPGPS